MRDAILHLIFVFRPTTLFLKTPPDPNYDEITLRECASFRVTKASRCFCHRQHFFARNNLKIVTRD